MKEDDVKISRKKPIFPVGTGLLKYLKAYQRDGKLPMTYSDLLNFQETIPSLDKFGNDTLWEIPLYPPHIQDTLYDQLKIVYAQLKASGNTRIVQHKVIEKIEFCAFGNTHPFRIKIVNRLNDVYDYFYIKQADASRIYGLELEEIISPNQVNYLYDRDTLVEEHIVGIPGDTFAKTKMDAPDYNQTRIAKEFVKFNERCVISMLGDMRAYNFVMQITPDFDDFQFRIRAIDFDQQFYEGNIKVYLPQFFKENLPFVKLSMDHLNEKTVLQYQQEERSSIVHRVRSERHRIKDLRDASSTQQLSTKENIEKLKEGYAKYYENENYFKCKSMTDIIELNVKNVIRQVQL
ncbi:hypothetical protein SMI01S_26120 [Sphingobacterium mizutaii NBRC 14946 = DSM 11724]|uniref:Uncharacterized protein n=2 Tax=Sphingobacterium mizutaii TaxID=1010 RepID=A0AAJ4XEE9_9SPHI|nr:hypothetical protein [Sphingobacterium mizutaii]GEM69006.1 hypothetical protein SMI01S_26120 [Sphingobacterium mizutaii NBRC 14946 = DSM 11724]SDL67623.1 hypothetical protein SAMN05192578_106123 [Sphingobacterium mizutaii]SNV56968.1 Uncharacterised protein [Sphingobacterium mizutaii]